MLNEEQLKKVEELQAQLNSILEDSQEKDEGSTVEDSPLVGEGDEDSMEENNEDSPHVGEEGSGVFPVMGADGSPLVVGNQEHSEGYVSPVGGEESPVGSSEGSDEDYTLSSFEGSPMEVEESFVGGLMGADGKPLSVGGSSVPSEPVDTLVDDEGYGGLGSGVGEGSSSVGEDDSPVGVLVGSEGSVVADSLVDNDVDSSGGVEGSVSEGSDVLTEYTDFMDEDYPVDNGVEEESVTEESEDEESVDEIVKRLSKHAPPPRKKKVGKKSRDAVDEPVEEEEEEEEEEPEVLGENTFLEPKVSQELVDKKNAEVMGDEFAQSDSIRWEFLDPEDKDDVPYIVFYSDDVPVMGIALTKRVTEELTAAMKRSHRFYVPAPVKKDKIHVRFVKWYKRALKKHGILTTMGSLLVGATAVFMVGMFSYTSLVNSRAWQLIFGG